MSNWKEQFVAFVKEAKLLDETGVAALVNAEEPDAAIVQSLMQNFTGHIANVTTTAKKAGFDEGHGKATREVLSTFESKVVEKYGVNPEGKQGLDLIDYIINDSVSKNSKAADTEDKVKNHTVYKQLNDKFVSLQTDYENVNNQFKELAQFKTQVEQEALNNKILDVGLKQFISLNPVLPTNDTAKEAQLNIFKRVLTNDYKFRPEKVDGVERFVLVDDEGKDKTLETGHRIFIEDVVPQITDTYYTRAKQQPVSGAGAGGGNGDGNPPAGNGKFTIPVMKTEQDYTKALDNAKSHEEKVAVKEAWEKQKQ